VPGADALIACAAGVLVAAVPRVGWLALTLVTAASLAIHGEPGAAVALSAAAAVPVILAPRDGAAWPLAAVAPALAGLNLATAWPALAGLTRRPRRRAVLAATGCLWAGLWSEHVSRHPGVHAAVHQVINPLATVGTLAACAAWAAAALALPWTGSRRWPALECLRLGLWALALALATIAAEHLGAPNVVANPAAALAGALGGALVVFVTRRLPPGRPRGLRAPPPAKDPPSTS
jgi:hypothetical protein